MELVSVIIPARNEAETIGRVLDAVTRQISLLPQYAFEVLVVADHCTDATERIAAEKQARVIPNALKRGKGNAIITGLSQARGSIIIMLDADGSHNPEDFPKFLQAIESGVHLVIGSRAKGGSDEYEIIRLFGNVVFTALVDFLFWIRLTDSLNGYKAFRRQVCEGYRYRSSGFEIEIELLYSALARNLRIGEVASHEMARQGGRMKSSTVFDGMRFLTAIIKWGCRYHFKGLFKKKLLC